MTDESRDRQAAMDLAEESRETRWLHPSFAGEIFQGAFRWEMLHPFPEQDPEDRRIGDEYIETVREVLENFIDPGEVDRTEELPNEALLALAEIGCFGLKIPREYDGLGLSQANYNRVIAFIATYCSATAACLSAHQSIGAPQPILVFGTEGQRRTYLPRLARGAVSGFALTEPGVGSDPAKMATTATPSEDGSSYVLTGQKLWCTNGPSAELVIVMALTPPRIIDGKERPQVTAFLVETDSPGFEVAHHCSFMGIRGVSNGLLRLNKVEVPAENMVGEPGRGLKIALETLNTGRLTVPASTAASGKAAMHHARKWSTEREQWGGPIGGHQAVGKILANIVADTFAMDSMNAVSCALVDQGAVDFRLEAAIAKYFCAETAWRIADDFVQVRGGRGYETAESLRARGEDPIPAERMLRDTRILRIIEGTSEIMRLFIAREAMDSHVRRILPILAKRGKMGGLVWDALKFYAVWYPKTWLPAPRNFNCRNLSGRNLRHLAFVSKYSRKLARTMFHTMIRFGQELDREQLVLQCLVDTGTDLFAMAVTLAHAEGALKDAPDKQALQDLADLFCRNARARVKANLRGVRQNHNGMVSRVAAHFMGGKYDWMVEGIYTDFPPSLRRPQRPEEESAPHAEPEEPDIETEPEVGEEETEQVPK
jgi:alkylation response protein AidB-like acyl-CoA dehydrogenase